MLIYIIYYSRDDSRRMLVEMKANGSFLVRPKIGAQASATEAVHTHTIDIMYVNCNAGLIYSCYHLGMMVSTKEFQFIVDLKEVMDLQSLSNLIP